ncbi:MAG: patatin-like phospholipase family protein [Comamonadaceae bacterium]|nr:MAG: patatin-like phospholipase family protein [Comamonadaceae bacterium]
MFAVTLSGGGARAAAFGYGVLQELRATPCCWNDKGGNMLDAVDVVSGVSGGSIIAAYYAAFGSEGLDNFETEYLRQNFQGSLLNQLLRPANLVDLTSPWFGRSQLLARRLDNLYRGMTFGDIERRPRHPQLLVTATDMSLGTGFEFTPEQFELICSDLSSVPLSFAVSASSAVPLLLSPLTLKNYSDDCRARGIVPRFLAPQRGGDYRARMLRSQEGSYLDARTRPFIHLVDGGLSDNLGVRRLLDRALASGSLRSSFSEVGIPAGSVRHLVLITVNSERDPSTRIDASDKVPGIAEVVDALLFGAGARATTETQEFLADLARQWQAELRLRSADGNDVFAAGATIHVIQVNLRDAQGDQRRSLLQVPTAFSIGNAEVSGLIEAGRGVLRASPEFQQLLRTMGVPAPAP